MGNHTEVFTVRKGTKNDVKAVHALIVELAIYERAEQEVSNTVDQLLRDGFGEDPVYELLVAERGTAVRGVAVSERQARGDGAFEENAEGHEAQGRPSHHPMDQCGSALQVPQNTSSALFLALAKAIPVCQA